MITGPGGFCFGDNGFAGFHRGLAGDAQIVGWGCLFREGSGDLGIWDGGMKQTDERVELGKTWKGMWMWRSQQSMQT